MKTLKTLLTLGLSIFVGLALFIYQALGFIFMESQQLIHNLELSGAIALGLSICFASIYKVIKPIKKSDKIILLTISVCITAPFLWSFTNYSLEWYKRETNYYILKRIPSGLHIARTIYKNEKAYGFGPGGNEQGLYIFEIPEDIAKKVDLNFLKRLPNTNADFEAYKDGEWSKSPYGDNKIDIHDYFFMIQPDKQLLQELAECLNNQGSYYIHLGGGAILLISPERDRAYYFYKG